MHLAEPVFLSNFLSCSDKVVLISFALLQRKTSPNSLLKITARGLYQRLIQMIREILFTDSICFYLNIYAPFQKFQLLCFLHHQAKVFIFKSEFLELLNQYIFFHFYKFFSPHHPQPQYDWSYCLLFITSILCIPFNLLRHS